MAFKNLHLHNEIRNWSTEQLIETLEFNGLGECSGAIANKQIDGEEFLNLNEGQLALWRNVLNTTQIRRLWSVIQLAKERPQDFVRSNSQKPTPSLPTVTRSAPLPPAVPVQIQQPTPTKSSVPTVTRNTPLPPTVPVQIEQLTPTKSSVPTVTRNTPLPPTVPAHFEQPPVNVKYIAPLPAKPETHYGNLSTPRPLQPPDQILPTKPTKFDDQFKPVPNKPPTASSSPVKPSISEEISPSSTTDRKPFAASLNNLLSQQLAIKDDAPPSSGGTGNYPLHCIRRKPSTTSIDSSASVDSLPLPPKPYSRQASPAPNETTPTQRSPTPNSYRPPPSPSNITLPTTAPEIPPNRSQLHTVIKFNTVQRPKAPPLAQPDTGADHFATLPKVKPPLDARDFDAPPLPSRPVEISPSQLSTRPAKPFLPPPNRVHNYPNVSIDAPPPPLSQVPSPSWAGNRPLPSPPKDEQPYILQVKDINATLGRKSPTVDILPRPPSLAPLNIEVDYEEPVEDEEAEYFFVDEVDTNNYKQQPWYKNVDRKEAQMCLKGLPNGSFLVRPGKKDDHECSFSVMCERRVYNIPVNKSGDKFIMGNTTFASIIEIVDKFTVSPLVLNGPMNQDLHVTLRRT